MMVDIRSFVLQMLRDLHKFTRFGSGLTLRSYQVEAAQAVVDSVIKRRGLSFVVIFPRQSGKNELQAQVESYLLTIYSQLDAEIVKVSPTWKPQSLNAMRRLERVLERNFICQATWRRESGYIYRMDKARISFLSGSPTTNVVGATANLLLECDEAQDVGIDKWDKDFAPMAASTNATKVFWGTAWTSRTLLARELRAGLEAEKRDGIKRVFVVDANEVAREVPAYGEFVKEQIQKLGRNHPMVRTQFFNEEIDSAGGMFPPERIARMQGKHESYHAPKPGVAYAVLVDVGGEDKDGSEHDSTAVTVVEIDLSTLADEVLKAPTYQVLERYLWTGESQSEIYGKVRGIVDHWMPRYCVVDSTGVGAGLASFLEKAFPGVIVPFYFSQKSKSQLGWGFLAVIETGRFKDTASADMLKELFYEQCEHCSLAVGEGPNKPMKWGVLDGTRNNHGDLVHDDLLISAALCAALDEQSWGLARGAVAGETDIFRGMSEVF